MIPNVMESTFYKIQEGTRNEFVARGSNGNVLRWADTGGFEQMWLLIPASESHCKIQCRSTGEFLTVNGLGQIFCAKEADIPEQEFSFVNYSDGWWNIQESTRDEFVAVSFTDGNVLRWFETRGRDQRFELIPVNKARKPQLEEGEALPGAIGNIPRIISYSIVPPERSEPKLIGEALIPAVFVNDTAYSDHRYQILQNPYYVLRREQYWDRSQGRGIYYQHDGQREVEKTFSIEFGISEKTSQKIEDTFGWKLSASGKFGFDKSSIALAGSLSRSIKTTTTNETEIKASKKETYKEKISEKKFAYAQYALVDHYRLFDKHKNVVREWEIVLYKTTMSDGFDAKEFTLEEGNCQLIHKYSDKYIYTKEKENGGAIYLWGPISQGDEDRYSFRVKPVGDGYYHIIHEYSGKYVCTGDKENGGAVHLWGPIPDGHEERYKFSLSPADEDYYYLIHKHSGKYVCSGAVNNGGFVHLWGPIPVGHEDRYKFKLSSV
ncbi:hypothetical protein N836_07325 [Leptolyngbya sp. Heron Island J]|uniref:RICIN domain-containing protein n=1 Tax=Leptolyngbya sp. Heron Island J TaxID=1385935 RepID=UPI0003B943A0|nr:RICIN domain-containing protein [Leptolyngbya sp. Heron Island J]ESA36578.1 hypothetical protein N836_07325 [Leptolyngbya sp. Heron Island J]